MSTDDSSARVGVYIDFDNIVISRYDQVHRRGAFQSDDARRHRPDGDGEVATRLRAARVDVDAIIDYASSFGRVVVSRAYADWSQPVNAGYHQQLIDRAVDLTQLFPVGPRMKNGADIRLAVDVIEDLFRLEDLTHVVIIAGDSDYIALAQRAKRLGRTVIGVGVAGSTSRSLMSACDEYADYDAILDTSAPPEDDEPDEPATAAPEPSPAADTSDERAAQPAPNGDRAAQRRATQLLMRAMRLIHAKKDDEPWLSYGEVKSQMMRLDPAFAERPLGFTSFSDFIASRSSIVEIAKETSKHQQRVRLRPSYR
ncbi:NYN domain-containing protein [Cellulomonas palmilytica]|uniref:NYN domain-containing protein n=1 Tax=Cellulomonas palmilytica TaxID=2608402 RepID=UPI001F3A61A2|nr:NYN domain-containing protein [Cellulomonas palmilytica]UJP38839.1 NYN domain-containing protein [Cellulomonas palmilytica]